MHKWITLLYTWNKQNIVNQLYFNSSSDVRMWELDHIEGWA